MFYFYLQWNSIIKIVIAHCKKKKQKVSPLFLPSDSTEVPTNYLKYFVYIVLDILSKCQCAHTPLFMYAFICLYLF